MFYLLAKSSVFLGTPLCATKLSGYPEPAVAVIILALRVDVGLCLHLSPIALFAAHWDGLVYFF